MNPDIARTFDEKKYMWDGEVYETRDAAEEKEQEYKGQGFDTQLVEEEGVYLVYNRRVAAEVVVEGPAPP